ncbi:MAG: DUF4339 domain-containing protein [Verrucomicrobiota bacterium]
MKLYYIFLNNSPEGPWSADQLEARLKAGTLPGSTLIGEAGGTDWLPATEMFPSSFRLPGSPPPLPGMEGGNPYAPPSNLSGRDPAPSMGHLDFPLLNGGSPFHGAEGLTAGQVVEMVRAGGRFVIWQFNFSLVVLSFKRSSGIQFLRPGESGAGACFGYSSISALFGWWGFPWGILWTPLCLFRNMMGGQDVTEPILATVLGPGEADRIVRQRPARSAGPTVLAALAPALGVIGLFMIFVVFAVATPSSSRRRLRSSAPHSTHTPSPGPHSDRTR